MLKVTVVEIRSGYVRLGFEADAKVAIHRSEVWEKIHTNGQSKLPKSGPRAAVARRARA